MKFPRIIQAVYFQPWLITPQAHAAIRTLLENRLSENYRAGLFDCTEDDDKPKSLLSVQNGVGIISIEGTILRKASALERMCGAVGVEQIADAMAEAEASEHVHSVILDIDSSGGTVGGVPELGGDIADLAKKMDVIAYTGGQMCSAAYWLAAGASSIVAAPSAEVGSIGVYLPWVDQTAAYEMEGYKVDVIRNEGADLKGMGYPGTSLTTEQREHLQAGVNEIAGLFHKHVQKHRGKLDADTLRGQAFLSEEASRRGLINDVGTLQTTIAQLTRQP